jgi:hypothetical protein
MASLERRLFLDDWGMSEIEHLRKWQVTWSLAQSDLPEVVERTIGPYCILLTDKTHPVSSGKTFNAVRITYQEDIK